MRVISGSARGHRLLSLEGVDTRPTSESVKEAMMSIVQFEIGGARVLDLYAGTGQLGVEALSRGAGYCTFIDSSARCRGVVSDNLERTKLGDNASVIVADVESWLGRATGTFDLIFADPPYEKGILPKILPLLAKLLHPVGAIICETDSGEQLPETVGNLKIKKEYKYGKRKLTLYRVVKEENE